VAERALVFHQARHDLGFDVQRPEARRADEAGGGRAHAFDRLGAERHLFDEYAGGEVLRHVGTPSLAREMAGFGAGQGAISSTESSGGGWPLLRAVRGTR